MAAPSSERSGVVAIVTGSSSGIGERTAQRLSELGAAVVVNSSSSVAAGEAVAAALPGESIYVQADIADADQCRRLLDATVDRFGKLDLLVNNAGWTTLVDHRDLTIRARLEKATGTSANQVIWVADRSTSREKPAVNLAKV